MCTLIAHWQKENVYDIWNERTVYSQKYAAVRNAMYLMNSELPFMHFLSSSTFLLLLLETKATWGWPHSCCSVAQLYLTLWDNHGLQHIRLPCPSTSPVVCSLMPIELVTPYHYLILCCPFLLLASIFPSISIFSNESALCIRWSLTLTHCREKLHPDHNFPRGVPTDLSKGDLSVVPLWWPDALGQGYVIGLVVYETMKEREAQKSP